MLYNRCQNNMKKYTEICYKKCPLFRTQSSGTSKILIITSLDFKRQNSRPKTRKPSTTITFITSLGLKTKLQHPHARKPSITLRITFAARECTQISPHKACRCWERSIGHHSDRIPQGMQGHRSIERPYQKNRNHNLHMCRCWEHSIDQQPDRKPHPGQSKREGT